MKSPARMWAGFGGKTRARLLLTVRRRAYEEALAPLPRITGTALVVGSAPGVTRPLSLDPSWFAISVNASQRVAEDFGIAVPDLTVFRDGMNKPGQHQEHAWAVLAGRRTRHLVISIGEPDDYGVPDILPTYDYTAEKLTSMSRHVRGAIIAEMTGRYFVTLSGPLGISNGIFAALLALKLGASTVVMSGFSFNHGWSYAPNIETKRGHLRGDAAICRAIVVRALPIYVSDTAFAAVGGLRPWTGTADR